MPQPRTTLLALAAMALALPATAHLSTAAFTSTSANTSTVRAAADWTPPTVSLLGAAPYLRGAEVALTVSARDGESRIAGVTVEQAPWGTDSWTRLCGASTETATCTWDTTTLDDGPYDVRAAATDTSGYSSSTISRVTVDNTAPTVTMKDPGSPLSGTRLFEATGVTDATSGVARVDIDYALGTGTWQPLCTVLPPTSTWSCSYDTTTLAEGSYSFRARALDVAGNGATSRSVTGRVENVLLPAPAGLDVQAVNGGAQQGLVEAGDTLTFTYAGRLDLTTVLPGWTGAATTVTVRLADASGTETLQVRGTNLGTVDLGGQVKKDRVLDVISTMTTATATVGGQERTLVTVTLGTLPSGSNGALDTVRVPTTLTWVTSGAVTDVLGRAVPVAVVTEAGAADVDF